MAIIHNNLLGTRGMFNTNLNLINQSTIFEKFRRIIALDCFLYLEPGPNKTTMVTSNNQINSLPTSGYNFEQIISGQTYTLLV